MTDGVFSASGNLAPLHDYLQILPENSWLWVDDAHGAGVLGAHARGVLEELEVTSSRVIQTVTLAKAMGVYGGAVLGPGWVRDLIHEKSGIFIGSTPLPLPLASAGLAALKIIEEDAAMRGRLRHNTELVKSSLAHAGLCRETNPSPIFSLLSPLRKTPEKASEELIKRAIYPSYIRYPGGPADGFFRFSISSEHTSGQLENLIEALAKVFP